MCLCVCVSLCVCVCEFVCVWVCVCVCVVYGVTLSHFYKPVFLFFLTLPSPLPPSLLHNYSYHLISFPSCRPVHHFSYMEEAKLRNRFMMEQYKAHLRQSSSQMLPASYHSAGLSMLRRLEENVSVAKIREQTVSSQCMFEFLKLMYIWVCGNNSTCY